MPTYRGCTASGVNDQFTKSVEMAYRRMVRSSVRACRDLTKGDREVLVAMLNLSWHYGGRRPIYPGVARLAKRAKVTERTVKRALAKFRAAGLIEVVSHASGGKGSTRYTLDEVAILVLCDAKLVAIWEQNVPRLKVEMSPGGGDKMSPDIKDRFDCTSTNTTVTGDETPEGGAQ